MPEVITILELQYAINRSRRLEPMRSGVLTPDLRAMADLYGRMIYDRARSVDLEQQPTYISETVRKWLQAENGLDGADVGVPLAEHQRPTTEEFAQALQVCPFRRGDPDFEACEACQ